MPPLQSLQSDFIFSKQVRHLLYRSISTMWYPAFRLCISLLGFFNSPFFFPSPPVSEARPDVGDDKVRAAVARDEEGPDCDQRLGMG